MIKSMIGNIVTKTMSRKLNGKVLQEADILLVLKQIRIALLDADVNIKVVKTFINNLRENLVDVEVAKNISPADFVLVAVKKELLIVLGTENKPIKFDKKLTKIMLVGLQGSGKTTTSGKIANFVKTKIDKKALLIACDIYRPAAIEQLGQLAKIINCDFYEEGINDPTKTIKNGIDFAKKQNDEVIIVDTAGRLQSDENLMQELIDIKKVFNPDEILFVVDALSGQDIVNVSKIFHEKLKLTGLIISKLDSSAKAGAAFSIKSILDIPIKFTGIGEKLTDLDIFYPERMAERILGMGDMVTLAEKAIEIVDEKKMKGQLERMLSGKMDLEDLMNQLSQMSKMGSVSGLVGMLPGMNKKLDDNKIIEIEKNLKSWKILMSSMTLKERRNPKIFKRQLNRKLRVIKGSGKKMDELNKLIKRWEDGNKQMLQIGAMMKKGQNPFKMN